MKKIISIIFCILAVFSCFIVTANALGNKTIETTSANIKEYYDEESSGNVAVINDKILIATEVYRVNKDGTVSKYVEPSEKELMQNIMRALIILGSGVVAIVLIINKKELEKPINLNFFKKKGENIYENI